MRSPQDTVKYLSKHTFSVSLHRKGNTRNFHGKILNIINSNEREQNLFLLHFSKFCFSFSFFFLNAHTHDLSSNIQ